jgi:two-component system, OmpR family, response regulator
MMNEKPQSSLDVLIVDDDRVTCYLLTVLMKQRDLHASYVYNFAQALELLKKQHYDILFLDNFLPDGFGVDFVERIKQLNPSVKIVIMTAEEIFNDISIAFEKGAQYYLPKPFTKEGLTHIFENVIEKCIKQKSTDHFR